MKARSIRLNASLCLLLSITAARAADFGETTGYFAVSSSGAATYSIPIWTPPGPNGLAPSISLDYNSQGGNGLAGVGWNLSAVSSIERCRRTKHQDGDNTEVNFTGGNAGDRFCIAGNRLRLTTGSVTYAGPAQKPGGMLIQILDSTNIGYSRDGVTPTPMWNIVLVPIPGMKGIWQVWTAFPADASSDGSE